ncbi:MAG: hypothetical protein KGL48_01150 [Sphingomonadales bacterium]|nr:hypothetical protein [Sphingomonadales bacterium]MDE2567742.1 hypothetical protein [Sphingomonadales bacterium]
MRLARLSLALMAVAALAACGSKDTDPGPGGVTVGEARTLDEAAEMLDARQLPPPAGQPGAQASDAGPRDAASSAAP